MAYHPWMPRKQPVDPEYADFISPPRKMTAAEVAAIMDAEGRLGENIKVAGRDRAWDPFSPASAEVRNVNRGKGAEEAVVARDRDGTGTMIYFAPFRVETLPSARRMLTFYASDMLFVWDAGAGP